MGSKEESDKYPGEANKASEEKEKKSKFLAVK